MNSKDQDILRSIKNGDDRKALEQIYKSMLPKIKKLVNVGTEREEDAKDILQEALLVFYKQVMTNKFDEKYEIAGFIYTVAKNLWLNQIKKNQRFVQLNESSVADIRDTNILDQITLEER